MRTLTVSKLFRPLKWRTQFVPWIRLSGNWLALAGFNPGEKVTVRAENGALIIEPLPERSSGNSSVCEIAQVGTQP